MKTQFVNSWLYSAFVLFIWRVICQWIDKRQVINYGVSNNRIPPYLIVLSNKNLNETSLPVPLCTQFKPRHKFLYNDICVYTLDVWLHKSHQLAIWDDNSLNIPHTSNTIITDSIAKIYPVKYALTNLRMCLICCIIRYIEYVYS